MFKCFGGVASIPKLNSILQIYAPSPNGPMDYRLWRNFGPLSWCLLKGFIQAATERQWSVSEAGSPAQQAGHELLLHIRHCGSKTTCAWSGKNLKGGRAKNQTLALLSAHAPICSLRFRLPSAFSMCSTRPRRAANRLLERKPGCT